MWHSGTRLSTFTSLTKNQPRPPPPSIQWNLSVTAIDVRFVDDGSSPVRPPFVPRSPPLSFPEPGYTRVHLMKSIITGLLLSFDSISAARWFGRLLRTLCLCFLGCLTWSLFDYSGGLNLFNRFSLSTFDIASVPSFLPTPSTPFLSFSSSSFFSSILNEIVWRLFSLRLRSFEDCQGRARRAREKARERENRERRTENRVWRGAIWTVWTRSGVATCRC